MQIEINIANKKATAKENYEIVCGNKDYKIIFTFDEEWNGHDIKTARFNFSKNGAKKHIDVLFNGTECDMPALSSISLVEIGVFAGDLQTTTPCVLKCQKSILCDGGTPEPPPSNVYDEFISMVKSSEDNAKEANAAAKEAEASAKNAKTSAKEAENSVKEAAASAKEAENIATEIANKYAEQLPQDPDALQNLLFSNVNNAPDYTLAVISDIFTTEPELYKKIKYVASLGMCNSVVSTGGKYDENFNAGKTFSEEEAKEIKKHIGNDVKTITAGVSNSNATKKANYIFNNAKDLTFSPSGSFFYEDASNLKIRVIYLSLSSEQVCVKDLSWFCLNALEVEQGYKILLVSDLNLTKLTVSKTLKVFKTILDKETAGEEYQYSMIPLSIKTGESEATTINGTFEITKTPMHPLEIIAAIHGGTKCDTLEYDLNNNFPNIGVADAYVPEDTTERLFLERFYINKLKTIKGTESPSTVTKNATLEISPLQLSVAGKIYRAWELRCTAATDDGTIIATTWDDTFVKDKYLITQLTVKMTGDTLLSLGTNQSRAISPAIPASTFRGQVGSDFGVITVVTNRVKSSPYYGTTDTYLNGEVVELHRADSLGMQLSNGTKATDIRLVIKNPELNGVVYLTDMVVYESTCYPSEDIIKKGVGYAYLFDYNGIFYFNYEKENLIEQLGGDLPCFDVFGISLDTKMIHVKRYGFGKDRSCSWTVSQ